MMSEERKPRFNLQSILDSHRNPFVLIDENYMIIEANKAYCERYDTSPGEVSGSKCHLIHHNSELPCHEHGEECPLKRVLDTGDQYEVLHVHHNHHHHPECVSIKGSPITDENGNRYMGEEIIHAAKSPDSSCEDSIETVEAKHIARLLEENHGHRRRVADLLNISERTLYRKLVKYELTSTGRAT